MRKVTEQIKQAFDQREAKTVGNTRTDGNTVWLHGNAIVKRDSYGLVHASLAGWNTPTTRERVNGITGLRFHQKNFTPMLNDNEVDSYDWHSVMLNKDPDILVF
jgi:hypothetical protein